MRKIIENLITKTGIDREIAEGFSWFLSLIVFFHLTISFIVGTVNANDSEWCQVKSISDVVLAPTYAAGCLIGKDRFNYRLN